MNVLVLNLTRLGDLLQSQPAVASLRAQGHRVGLVCLDNFAGAAGLMQGVDAVFRLPGARLLARLDSDWRQALTEHRTLVEGIRRDFPPDLVINLTPSEPARLLAMTLGAPKTLGFALDAHGFNADTSLWAAFLQLAAGSRGSSPFNVVDMFRRIAGLSGPPEQDFRLRGPAAEERAAASARLQELVAASGPKGFVALQLGASAEARRWPVAHFSRLAEGLLDAGYTPVLLGTAPERHLAEELKALLGPRAAAVADLVGATNLPGLAATLCACKLLVTNDTGTMHLAAGLGVPCLAIFLATAQPWDTGPYLPGCISLEPDMDCHPCPFGKRCESDGSCRGAIGGAGVRDLALAMLEGADALPAVPGARVWRSRIGADGLMDLESLSGHEESDRTRLIRLQRALYRPHLDGEGLPPGHVLAGGVSGLSPALAASLTASLSECGQLLVLLERQGALLARDPLPAMKTKFLATWQRVRGVLEADPKLSLLASLWTFEAERPGQGLPEIMALAGRFALLLERMREAIVGTHVA